MAKAAAPKKAVKKPAKKTAVKKAVPQKTAAKKTAAPASAATKKKKPVISIKYADKSAGQPEMVEIFEEIKKRILPYDGKRSLKIFADTYGQVNLISLKPVEIEGRQRNELWFVSALIQKGYVGFYFMPTYIREQMKKEMSPAFMKMLKGKGCFHIKQNDPAVMKDIEKAIKMGYEVYVQLGLL